MNSKQSSKAKKRTWLWLLPVIIIGAGIIYLSMNKIGGNKSMNFTDIHGLGYTSDGKQIMVPAHDGLKAFTEGKWNAAEGKGHDYMGFNKVDNGFYSSGHPAEGSGMKNPLGIVKSVDDGKTLQTLDLYGEDDFHGMAVGYKTHAIYVFNSKPNSKMNAAGLYYSTDETKTWKKSDLAGLESQVMSIGVHPTDAAIVAVGTQNGVYISKDNGNHFEKGSTTRATSVAFGGNGDLFVGGSQSLTRLRGSQATELSIPTLVKDDAIAYIAQNPVNENELTFATFSKDIYISRNAGTSWDKIVDQGKGISK